MKGEKFTAENPTPKPDKRTTVSGRPTPDAFFENETDEAAVFESEAISEKQIDKEEAAIDALLDGDDGALDDLEYSPSFSTPSGSTRPMCALSLSVTFCCGSRNRSALAMI